MSTPAPTDVALYLRELAHVHHRAAPDAVERAGLEDHFEQVLLRWVTDEQARETWRRHFREEAPLEAGGHFLVVAIGGDEARARILTLIAPGDVATPGPLLEIAALRCPRELGHERARAELLRFVAQTLADLHRVGHQPTHAVIAAPEPLVALVRPLVAALPGCAIRELPCDVARLSPRELHGLLAEAGLLPGTADARSPPHDEHQAS